jgi:S-DNA-T family DNA segregation ATPase FtsK/SpoIIIE
VLHWQWPGWWQVVAAVGLAAGLIVGDLGHRLGLDRPIERAYAATVTATAGLWLAAATRLGPLRRPLLPVLLAGVLVGGVPWWTHHRRRAKVRVVRAMTTWAEDAAAADLDGAHLQRVDVTPDGQQWTARLLLPKGKTLADALTRVPKLESALGLRPRAIRVEEDPTLARRVILRVVTRDPHVRPLPLPELAGRPDHHPARPGRRVRDRRAAAGQPAQKARPVRRRDRVGQEHPAQRLPRHPGPRP